MAKKYDINSVLGTSFTYQLYANMAVENEGNSLVTCSAESVASTSWIARTDVFLGYYTWNNNLFAWKNDTVNGNVQIFKTTDLGVSWNLVHTFVGQEFFFNQTVFINADGVLYLWAGQAFSEPIFATTVDGENWSATTFTLLPITDLRSLAYINGVWIYGGVDEIYVLSGSPEPSWEPTLTPVFSFTNGDNPVNVPITIGGTLYFLGSPFYFSSSDGVNWTSTSTPGTWPTTFGPYNTRSYQGGVLTMDSRGRWAEFSADLSSWEFVFQNPTNAPLNFGYRLAVNDSDIYAYDIGATLYYLEQN